MLAKFLQESKPVFVLSGAGCSTASGIPDYRDASGEWKKSRPVNYADFVNDENIRRKYWMRSMLGWRRINNARPNPAHTALAKLERMSIIQHIVTQNVDGLHQKAGSRCVTELHGNLETVSCLDCGQVYQRVHVQSVLERLNPQFIQRPARTLADGDALVNEVDHDGFLIPRCDACHGLLKPDVVFFGESVPRERVHNALAELEASLGMLVLGSSLMVYSGFRFCRHARQNNIPVAAVNLGRTRADADFLFKISADCGQTLVAALDGAAGVPT